MVNVIEVISKEEGVKFQVKKKIMECFEMCVKSDIVPTWTVVETARHLFYGKRD